MAKEANRTGAPTLAQRLLNNTVYNLIGTVWSIGLSFVATPYIVAKLGNQMYGAFSVVMVIAGYFALLDLGFGSALIKYMSEKERGDDPREASRTVGTAIASNLAGGLAGAAAMYFGANYLAASFVKAPGGISAETLGVAASSIRICAWIFFLNMASAVFLAIPQSRQRFDLLNWMRTLSKTALTLGMVVVLANGGTLVHVLYSYAVITLFSLLYFFAASRALMPREMSFAPCFDGDAFKRLFSFGALTTVGKVAALLVHQLDRLIIGALLSVEWVSYYTVPTMLSTWIMQIASLIAPVIFPAASELVSTGSTDKLQKLLTRAMKYCYIMTLPLFVLLAAMPHEALRFWLGEKIGPDYAAKSSVVLVLLSAGALFEALTAVLNMIIIGIGRPDIQAYFAIVAGTMSVILLAVLVPRFGIDGAAFTYAIVAALVSAGYFFFCTAKMKFKSFNILYDSMGPASAAGVLNFVFLWLIKSHINGIASLMGFSIIGGFVYLAGLFLFKAVGAEEVSLAMSYLRVRRQINENR